MKTKIRAELFKFTTTEGKFRKMNLQPQGKVRLISRRVRAVKLHTQAQNLKFVKRINYLRQKRRS